MHSKRPLVIVDITTCFRVIFLEMEIKHISYSLFDSLLTGLLPFSYPLIHI